MIPESSKERYRKVPEINDIPKQKEALFPRELLELAFERFINKHIEGGTATDFYMFLLNLKREDNINR